MSNQVYVEIYRKSDGHVESRMGPMSERRAIRVESGASINLNHDAYATRILDEEGLEEDLDDGIDYSDSRVAQGMGCATGPSDEPS